MPDQHREFFGLLPYLFTATLDERGWPMASVLTGGKGFVAIARSADAPHRRASDGGRSGRTGLRAAGPEIGLIGLDFTTRRRNRANGRLVAVNDGLTVRIAQSFGNCAQYIQTRDAAPRALAPPRVEELAGLERQRARLIAASDTFFVASRSRPEMGAAGGLDMSHRGGRPGFVGVLGDTLAIPDFRGNRFYNTLGNLLGDPRAGLIFIDFADGRHPAAARHGDDRLASRRRPDRRRAVVATPGRARLAPPRRLSLRLDLRRLRADHPSDGGLVRAAPAPRGPTGRGRPRPHRCCRRIVHAPRHPARAPGGRTS